MLGNIVETFFEYRMAKCEKEAIAVKTTYTNKDKKEN